jgi:dolichol-phosphate mannosyltransferase
MLSIVMPAYNEAEIIEQSVREWHDEVVRALPGSELIVIDDCSSDGTGRVLAALAGQLPALRVLKPGSNGGHGRALRLGFGCATQPFVFQTDSDRQHDPSDFWKLWAFRDQYDFAFGCRPVRADGSFRWFIARSMRILNWVIWGVWIRDANCPFKLMRRGPLEQVLARIPQDSFIPMVMVSILARTMRFRVAEQVVSHRARRGGQQSLKGAWRWLQVASRCTWQLVRLRFS